MSSENLATIPKTFGERLELIRKSLKMTQSNFAKPLGIKGGMISAVETGKNILSPRVVQLLELHYCVNKKYLEEGKGPMFHPDVRQEGSGRVIGLKTIAILGTVPGGPPEEIEGEIIDYMYIPDPPENSYALRVKGESMRPLLEDGDYVLFRLGNDCKNGDVVIVNDEWGQSQVKRYREKDGKQFLVSENPEYPAWQPNEHYRIVGVVLEKVTRRKI